MNAANNSEPLVSVLIPCFNAARWIGETLQCLADQTYPHIEVIVVDDGSSDNSCEIVETFPWDRIRLLRQTNAGAAAARNAALRESRGDFIQFLDADDLLASDKIARQLESLKNSPGAVSVSAWARFFHSRSEAVFAPDDTWYDLAPVDWLVASWKAGGGMLFPARWLLPRVVAEKAGPWNECLTLNDDGEYFTRVVLASDEVLFCKEASSYYRSGIPGSLSGQKSLAAWKSQTRSIELCGQHLLRREDSERTRLVVARLWQQFACACYPYQPELASQGLRRAKALHPAPLQPDGGPIFKLAAAVIGWRLARRVQRWSGRP